MDHFFFSCSMEKLIWSLLRCSFDLASIPVNLHDCFGRWIRTFLKCEKQLVLVGISALFWSIWRCRNDVIFNCKNHCDPMTIVRLLCNWIIEWPVLQKKKNQRKKH